MVNISKENSAAKNNPQTDALEYDEFLRRHDADGSGTISVEELESQSAQDDYAQLSDALQKRALTEMFPDTARRIFRFISPKLGYVVHDQVSEALEVNGLIDDHEIITDPAKFGTRAVNPIAVQVFTKTKAAVKTEMFSERGLNLMQAAEAELLRETMIVTVVDDSETEDFSGKLQEIEIQFPIRNIEEVPGTARTTYYGDQSIQVTKFEDAEGQTWYTLASQKSLVEDLEQQPWRSLVGNVSNPIVSKTPVFGSHFQRVRSSKNDAATAHFAQETFYDFAKAMVGVEGRPDSSGPYQGVINYNNRTNGGGGINPYGGGYGYGDGFTQESGFQNSYSSAILEFVGWANALALVSPNFPPRPQGRYNSATSAMRTGFIDTVAQMFELWALQTKGLTTKNRPWTFGDERLTPSVQGDFIFDLANPSSNGRHIDHTRDLDDEQPQWVQSGIWMKALYRLVEGDGTNQGLRQIYQDEALAFSRCMKLMIALTEAYIEEFGEQVWLQTHFTLGALSWDVAQRFFTTEAEREAAQRAFQAVGLIE